MHKKRIKNKFYYYSTIREGGKTKSVYLGKILSEARKKEQRLIPRSKSFGFNWRGFFIVVALLLIFFGIEFYKYDTEESGFFSKITGLAVFTTNSEAEFDEGTYYLTNASTDSGVLILDNTSDLKEYLTIGNYTSKVFDASVDSVWNNISWVEGAPYNEELPADQEDELNNGIMGGANMSDNVFLVHFNNDSNYNWGNESHIYDFSGSGNNGTFYNNFSTEVGSDTGTSGANLTDYKLGTGSWTFDGDGDVAHFGNNPNLSINGSGAVELWMKKNQNADMSLLQKNETASASRANYMFFSYSDGQFACFIGNGVTNNNALVSAGTFPVGVWHHLVCTWDGSNIKLYKNGFEIVSNPQTIVPLAANSDPLLIGGTTIPNSPNAIVSYFFNGSIDEVAIWNRSLSVDEVLNHYKRGVLRLNLTVKSCDDANCDGEAFVGPDNSGDTAFENSTLVELNPTLTPNNRYFQYQFVLGTENETVTPELYNVTVDYSSANTAPNNPAVVLNFTYDNTNYTNESMWCEVYVNDDDSETDMSVDLIVMNSTQNDIDTAVQQFSLSSAFSSITEPSYVSLNITEQNFTKGDYVWCQARVYDQDDYSSWVNSTVLLVENYPIKISDPLGNWSTPSEGSINEDFTNFTIYWGGNWTDADNATYYASETYINWTFFMNDTEILGIEMNNDTDTVTIGRLDNASGTVEVNWSIIDSSEAEFNETVYWTINAVNDAPWWNETANTTYSYSEDSGNFNVWDEAGLNNTFWDVEDNHLPYNCTASANDTNIVTNVTYNDAGINANSVDNVSGAFILTVNCSDSGWESVLTSFDVVINAINDAPSVPILNQPDDEVTISGQPVLNWSNSTDIEDDTIYYVLQISASSSFTEPITYYNGSIKETENVTSDVSISGLPDNTYYWRVLASDLSDNSSFTASRRFTISTPTTTTTTPTTEVKEVPSGSDTGAPPNPTRLSTSTSIDIGKGELVTLTTTQGASFTTKGTEHNIDIKEIKQDSVKIWIYSNPIQIILHIGKRANIDLDSDTLADIRIELRSIKNNNAFLYIKELENTKITIPAGQQVIIEEQFELPKITLITKDMIKKFWISIIQNFEKFIQNNINYWIKNIKIKKTWLILSIIFIILLLLFFTKSLKFFLKKKESHHLRKIKKRLRKKHHPKKIKSSKKKKNKIRSRTTRKRSHKKIEKKTS